eukprot:Plantae.Rhodophyta-Purpureofilum_apyrenoidigerum.ctg5044.p2 GENE.Plantae.Rhodophyta-Purpureofilum_apyrenoidigerum.ctg5044~~Plantae.Rhodophyta-Purpureofilum_apyrenoidigerum.ctg5044.p2  ORF type:complete len:358 (-),score=55.19 Plantae.Rhodophyta-Purpureofilum_apyrenoidigerum.ctg5044:1631-2704(-)
MTATNFVLGFPVYAIGRSGGDRIVVGGGGGAVKSGVPNGLFAYDVSPTGKFENLTQNEVPDAITSLAVSFKNDSVIATVGGECKLFSVGENGRTITSPELSAFEDKPTAPVAFAFAGPTRLLVGLESGEVNVYAYPGLSKIGSFSKHKDSVLNMDATPDGKFAISTSRLSCLIWDTSSSTEVMNIKPRAKTAHIRAVRVHTPTGFFLTGENDNKSGASLSVWRQEESSWFRTSNTKIFSDMATAMCVSSSGLVAVGGADGNIAVVKIDGSGTVQRLFCPRKPPHLLVITALCFTEHSETLVSASADSTVRAYPMSVIETVSNVNALIALLVLLAVASFFMGLYLNHLQTWLRDRSYH